MPKLALTDQTFENIQAYCLNPNADRTALLPEQKKILDRWISASKVLDKYPIQSKAVAIHMKKYPEIGRTQAWDDLKKAKKLFNSLHTFDYEWWHSWLINDICKQIEAAKQAGDLKAWAKGHENLQKAIGNKPDVPIDPRLIEQHIFIIPIQVRDEVIKLDYNTYLEIPPHIRRKLTNKLDQEIDDIEAGEIMQS
jgi:hypothetical protein